MAKTDGLKNPPEVIIRIAALLDEKRYRPGAFGLALKMSRQWGHAVMKNQIGLTAAMLARIAEMLGVSMDSLWFGDGNQEKKNFEEYVKKLCDERIDERLPK